ncbi:hypothetical protein [Streptomyces sp. SCUT-3]|uniref:hypothetical protein n=1 Tax=Streptomyces sp. SCUT-3 TaxID=2684469 RepID=UPI0026A82B29
MEERAAKAPVEPVEPVEPDGTVEPEEDEEPDEVEEAEAVCGELAEALKEAGVTLPSLWLDVPRRTWWATPLVDLGRCNVATARALAAALRRGVGRAEPGPGSCGPGS